MTHAIVRSVPVGVGVVTVQSLYFAVVDVIVPFSSVVVAGRRDRPFSVCVYRSFLVVEAQGA